MQEEKKYSYSGFVLKMIAVITMLIDHTGATIVERYMTNNEIYWGSDDPVYFLYRIMRGIGRIAFPIYCYLLVEGFKYTRSKKNYAIRLLIFAALSEVPFDMAFMYSFFDTAYNSVFLTLLIGLLTIWGLSVVTERIENKYLRIFLYIITGLLGMLLAELLNTDYGAGGVIAIIIFYAFRDKKELSMLLGVLSLALTCGASEALAIIDVLFIHFYNGTRGRQAKYFFYLFYPVHLLILSLICYFLGYGI